MARQHDTGGQTMSNLYELSAKMKAVQAMDDIDEQTLMDTLESLEMEFTEKASNIARWVRDLEGDSEKIDAEIARLRSKKSAVDRKVESLKEYVRSTMIASGRTKIDDGVNTWRTQNNPPSVVVDSEESIPLCYYTEKVVRNLDKNAIKQAIVAGCEIPGAHLAQTVGIRLK